MRREPTAHEWNEKFVNLTHATLGLLTPNVRLVTLDWHEGQWVVTITVETDDPIEAEELGDILGVFEASEDDCNLRGGIKIDPGALEIGPPNTTRVIYLRREDGEFGSAKPLAGSSD